MEKVSINGQRICWTKQHTHIDRHELSFIISNQVPAHNRVAGGLHEMFEEFGKINPNYSDNNGIHAEQTPPPGQPNDKSLKKGGLS